MWWATFFALDVIFPNSIMRLLKYPFSALIFETNYIPHQLYCLLTQ